MYFCDGTLAGEDIESSVNLPELLRWVVPVAGDTQLRADGDDVIEYLFDLRNEPYVGGAQIEALVGNDYRVDVVGLYRASDRGNNEELVWSVGGETIQGSNSVPGAIRSLRNTAGIRAEARSEGTVQDLSNLGWITLNVGGWTGRALWGLDGSWEVGGAKVKWEYARSAEYRQYPDGQPGFRDSRDFATVRQWNGDRSSTSSGAYYLTAQWRRGMLESGGEVFSIDEQYNSGFVEDNDDDDRYPDIGHGHRPVIFYTSPDYDPDGVFPGKDEDSDGIPDTNRNGNTIPDYLEPFLRFDVEPDQFVYGRDWNNNGIVDLREDDLRPDYPYEVDQHGTHVYGRLHLPHGFGLSAGRLDAEGITSGARNESLYG